jgi:hypothetical protein
VLLRRHGKARSKTAGDVVRFHTARKLTLLAHVPDAYRPGRLVAGGSRYRAPSCRREVPNSEIVKGYEFEKGRYAVLSEEDFDKVPPESTRVIDLVQFADDSAIVPIHVEGLRLAGRDDAFLAIVCPGHELVRVHPHDLGRRGNVPPPCWHETPGCSAAARTCPRAHPRHPATSW